MIVWDCGELSISLVMCTCSKSGTGQFSKLTDLDKQP